MADIEVIARRIFEAYCLRTGFRCPSWEELPEGPSDPSLSRNLFRYMAGASLEPITGTLDLGQEGQALVPDAQPNDRFLDTGTFWKNSVEAAQKLRVR